MHIIPLLYLSSMLLWPNCHEQLSISFFFFFFWPLESYKMKIHDHIKIFPKSFPFSVILEHEIQSSPFENIKKFCVEITPRNSWNHVISKKKLKKDH